MKHIILAPDSFKGTLSAQGVCKAMEIGARRVFPDLKVSAAPMADGGEGTVDALLTAAGGEKRTVTVQNPFGENINASYGVLPDGSAIIEMSACAGLPLAAGRLNPEKTTTYGVGQLLVDAVGSGCKRVILGLGGSCTNDGGTGAAAAAGAIFYDKDGNEFIPLGGRLSQIESMDVSRLKENFRGVEIIAMCDIDNPLCGKTGASAIFAPQKGADSLMVERLDRGLQHLSGIAEKSLGICAGELPGAGAAGGMGFGMVTFFGAALRPGIETVLDAVNFDEMLKTADLVLTGEGSTDSQSVRGKVVSGVSRRAKQVGVPVIALAGQLGEGFEALYDMGLSAAFSINRAPVPFKEAAPHTAENLALITESLFRLLKVMEKN